MTNFIRTTFCSTVLALFAVAQPVHALKAELASPGSFVVAIADDDAYTVGTRAMDEHRWPDAVSAFDKVISEKGKRVDAALYWKAYSLNMLGKTPLAIATCDQLHSQFADSPWNKDCSVISVDVRANARAIADQMRIDRDQVRTYVKVAPFRLDMDRGESGVARGSDEDLKILASQFAAESGPYYCSSATSRHSERQSTTQCEKTCTVCLGAEQIARCREHPARCCTWEARSSTAGTGNPDDGGVSRQACQRYAGRGLPYDDRSEDQEVDYLRHVYHEGRAAHGRDGAERKRSRVETDHRLPARLDE